MNAIDEFFPHWRKYQKMRGNPRDMARIQKSLIRARQLLNSHPRNRELVIDFGDRRYDSPRAKLLAMLGNRDDRCHWPNTPCAVMYPEGIK